MKSITLLQPTLLKALKIVQPTINNRTVIPILTCVKVDVGKSKIVFTANNQELIIEHTVIHESEEAFNFCVPFDVLNNIASVCVDDITISVNGKQLAITSGVNNFNIMTDDSKDFLNTPSANGSIDLVLPDNLMQSIGNAYTALHNGKLIGAATENVLLDVTTENVFVVATNLNVLFKETLNCFDNKETQILLSRSLCKAIKDYPSVSEVRYTKKNVFVLLENTKYITVAAEGKYPDYNRIIPTGEPNISFDILEAKNALNCVAAIGKMDFAPIADLNIETDKATLSIKNSVFSYDSTSSFTIQNNDNSTIEAALNLGYIETGLRFFENIGAKRVDGLLKEANKPMVLTSEGSNIRVAVFVNAKPQ